MNRSLRNALIIGLALATYGCALNQRRTLPAAQMSQLWEDPVDLESRDLFNGPAGPGMEPNANDHFTVTGKKSSGTQLGYDVKDAHGQEWSVKLGVESRVEVAVSRLVWAIGYHQPAVYHVPKWTLSGDGADRTEQPARMRRESADAKTDRKWSWSNNPFVGTRPLAGLFVMMVMVNNWDLKTAQNPVYELTDGGKHRTQYMVRDLGASLGKTAWIRMATKDDPAGFESEPFIEGVEANRVRFHYRGGWLEPHLGGSIAPADVRWLCALLNRLSPAQMRDAFRAGGFTDAEGLRYATRLREKISEGLLVR